VSVRVGQGWDVHRTAAGGPLRLGGVDVDTDFHLVGHSDADALLHAVTDAILGAAGLGDIGHQFPDTDAAYKDADSARLLAEAVRMVREAGYEPASADATVKIERPKLADAKWRMRERIAGLLGLAPEAVSVKAKTAEGFGAVGRGEAVEALAVCVLKRGR